LQKYNILNIRDPRNGKQEATLLIQRAFTMNLNFCWSWPLFKAAV